MTNKDNIKTAVRWRPATDSKKLIEKEITIDSVRINNHVYGLGNVFEDSNQSDVYTMLVEPLTKKVIDGFDCTFIVTGQTGSGKTYTMFDGFENCENPENNGMIMRALNSLFSRQNAEGIKMHVSFVEVYNNQAFDLLSDSPSVAFYTKNDCHRKAKVVKKSIETEVEAHTVISSGMKRRRVRKTNMNTSSSRSHAILTIYTEITQSENQEARNSTLNLIDLAGSEGVEKTGNIGQSADEGKQINKDLLVFKRVIMEISKPKCGHIPFGEAVLTKVLRETLSTRPGTRLCVTMLGCVSPYEADIGETMSTLQFVSDAKKMTPKLNTFITEYQKSITPVKQTPHSHLKTPSSKLRNQLKRPNGLMFSNIKPTPNRFPLRLSQMSEPKSKFTKYSHTNIGPRFPSAIKLSTSNRPKHDPLSKDAKTFRAKSLFPTTNGAKPEIKSVLADSTTCACKLPTLQPVEIPACNQIVVEETEIPKMDVPIQPVDVKMTCSLAEECIQNVVEETEIPKMDVSIQPIDVKMTCPLPEECSQIVVEETKIPKMDVSIQPIDVEMTCALAEECIQNVVEETENPKMDVSIQPIDVKMTCLLPEECSQNVVEETQNPKIDVFGQPIDVEMACSLPEEHTHNITCTAISPKPISQHNSLQAEDFDPKVSTNVTIDFETKEDDNLMVSSQDFEGIMKPITSSTLHNLMEESIENILGTPVQLLERKSLLESTFASTFASISPNPNISLDVTRYEIQTQTKLVDSPSQSPKTAVPLFVPPLRLRKIPKNVNHNVAPVDIADYSFQNDLPIAEASFETQSPVVEATANIRMRCPISPRVILQRISSIEEYNLLVLGHKASRGQVNKKPRKARAIQKKVPQKVTKSKGNARKIDREQQILDLLKFGTHKQITNEVLLIGSKRATIIINRRGSENEIKKIADLKGILGAHYRKFIESNCLQN